MIVPLRANRRGTLPCFARRCLFYSDLACRGGGGKGGEGGGQTEMQTPSARRYKRPQMKERPVDVTNDQRAA